MHPLNPIDCFTAPKPQARTGQAEASPALFSLAMEEDAAVEDVAAKTATGQGDKVTTLKGLLPTKLWNFGSDRVDTIFSKMTDAEPLAQLGLLAPAVGPEGKSSEGVTSPPEANGIQEPSGAPQDFLAVRSPDSDPAALPATVPSEAVPHPVGFLQWTQLEPPPDTWDQPLSEVTEGGTDKGHAFAPAQSYGAQDRVAPAARAKTVAPPVSQQVSAGSEEFSTLGVNAAQAAGASSDAHDRARLPSSSVRFDGIVKQSHSQGSKPLTALQVAPAPSTSFAEPKSRLGHDAPIQNPAPIAPGISVERLGSASIETSVQVEAEAERLTSQPIKAQGNGPKAEPAVGELRSVERLATETVRSTAHPTMPSLESAKSLVKQDESVTAVEPPSGRKPVNGREQALLSEEDIGHAGEKGDRLEKPAPRDLTKGSLANLNDRKDRPNSEAEIRPPSPTQVAVPPGRTSTAPTDGRVTIRRILAPESPTPLAASAQIPHPSPRLTERSDRGTDKSSALKGDVRVISVAEPVAQTTTQSAVQPNLIDGSQRLSDIAKVQQDQRLGPDPLPHARPGSVPPNDQTGQDLVTKFAQKLAGARTDAFEIELSPRELGRVTFQMRPTAEGLTVQIITERPEVQDLVRRHLDDFSRDLRNLGHASVAFGFGGSQKGSAEAWSGREPAGPFASKLDPIEPSATLPTRMSLGSGVDIRL